MKFGTMQSVLGEPLPGAFSVAKKLGFDGIEIECGKADAIEPAGEFAPARRAEIRAAACQAGVEIPSVCAGCLNGLLAAPDPSARQNAIGLARRLIELSHDLGASVLLIPFFGDGEILDEAAMQRVTESIRQLEPDAAAARVTLAIEHTLRADRAAALIDAIGSPRFGDYWDMGNSMSLGFDPLAEIESLGRRIAQVHAKEYSGTEVAAGPGEYPGLNRDPFGKGKVPVSGVIRKLRAQGYDGWIVLETGAFGNRKESARTALEILKIAGG